MREQPPMTMTFRKFLQVIPINSRKHTKEKLMGKISENVFSFPEVSKLGFSGQSDQNKLFYIRVPW